MKIQFAQPLLLLLLIPLTLHVLWMGRHLQLLSPARRATAILVRLLILFCLVGALAGMRCVRESKELNVFYLIDQSDSIPAPQRELAGAFVETTQEEMGAHDRAGMIVFGSDAAVEKSPVPTFEYEPVRAVVDRSRSNLADAMQLALACFIGEFQKRIVLISDGNENMGDAIEAARAAAAGGVVIDVMPLRYVNHNDVMVEKALVENRVNLEEPFDVKVIATARAATEGKLSIHQDGHLVDQYDVQLLPERKNVFVFTTQTRSAGFHTFDVQLDVPDDLIPENNRAFTFTYGAGEPRVLLVDGDAQPDHTLSTMLLDEKVKVDWTDPSGLPHSIHELQSYDALIFNNVAASELTGLQMRMIERSVHDLGMGFVMIGGENSFGAGGYNDSPIEHILPVDMEIKDEKIMPQGALVPIVHTVEIPEGQYWAEQIVLAALDVLSPRDLMGVLYYDWQNGEDWLFPLQPVGAKTHLRNIIHGIQPGDMPSFDTTMQMAYKALDNSGASVKHIVVISDGDPATPNPALARKIKNAKITISTVCINPHSQRDQNVMQDLARLGGGNYYYVTAFDELPQIFIKEAATVRRSLLVEEPFRPVSHQCSPLLVGFGEDYPILQGYVGTGVKPMADLPLLTHQEAPLLAHWRHGVGKTVAFTSDAKPRWAATWLEWDQFSKFWVQIVRWSLRTPFNRNFQVQMEVDGAQGRIMIDAVDAAGQFRNFLQIQGSVIHPSFETQQVTFRQTSPGRYEAPFDVREPGNYMLGALAGQTGEEIDGGGDLITGGATLSFSPEFQSSHSNEALLYQIADITGGRVLDASSPVFLHDLIAYIEPQKLWPILLLWVLGLFLLDVFVRRVLIGWADVMAGVRVSRQWAWRRLRPQPTAVATGPTDELLQTKQKIRTREQALDTARREAFVASLQQVEIKRSALDEAGSALHEKKPEMQTKTLEGEPTGSPVEAEEYTDELLRARSKVRRQFHQHKQEDQDHE